jgi:hypothetical protein
MTEGVKALQSITLEPFLTQPVGNRDMAGGLGSRTGKSAVAVERCGKQPRDN